MPHQVCIIQGHPHGASAHLCHAIAKAYAEGASKNGSEVSTVDLGKLDVPLFRNPEDFATPPPDGILQAQASIAKAQHIVVIFPLWLGTMPAVVKAFFEQLCRNGFAIQNDGDSAWPKQMLKGKSARVIVTMGMPALAYRFMFGAHGVRALEKSILGMSGIKPVRRTLIGNVGAINPSNASKLLDGIRKQGERLA
jgi:putative NADPH-quinone reductase